MVPTRSVLRRPAELVDCDAPTPTRLPLAGALRGPRLLPPYEDDTEERPAVSLPASTQRMDQPLPPPTSRSLAPPTSAPSSRSSAPRRATAAPARPPTRRHAPAPGATTLALGSPSDVAILHVTPRNSERSSEPPPTRAAARRAPSGVGSRSSAPAAAAGGDDEEPPPPAQRRPRPELSRRIMLFSGSPPEVKSTRKRKAKQERAPLGWMAFGIAGFTFGCLSLAALAGTLAGGHFAAERPASTVPVASAQPISLEARIESCTDCTPSERLEAPRPPAKPQIPAPKRPHRTAPAPPSASSSALPSGLPSAGL